MNHKKKLLWGLWVNPKQDSPELMEKKRQWREKESARQALLVVSTVVKGPSTNIVGTD